MNQECEAAPQLSVWLTLQPNGVVYMTHSRPEMEHDDWWLTDDNSHDFLIIPNSFCMTMEKRIIQAQIEIVVVSQPKTGGSTDSPHKGV